MFVERCFLSSPTRAWVLHALLHACKATYVVMITMVPAASAVYLRFGLCVIEVNMTKVILKVTIMEFCPSAGHTDKYESVMIHQS
jgi:hypothetical protein